MKEICSEGEEIKEMPDFAENHTDRMCYIRTKRGGGVPKFRNVADILYKLPLSMINSKQNKSSSFSLGAGKSLP